MSFFGVTDCGFCRLGSVRQLKQPVLGKIKDTLIEPPASLEIAENAERI